MISRSEIGLGFPYEYNTTYKLDNHTIKVVAESTETVIKSVSAFCFNAEWIQILTSSSDAVLIKNYNFFSIIKG
jgi:hypothetical protein